MVPWFLITSYGYYQLDVSLLTDERFDQLCRDLLAEWETIEHRHKCFISLEDLKAGTGYATNQWPSMVVGGFHYLHRRLR